MTKLLCRALMTPFGGEMILFQLAATSSAVNGEPSVAHRRQRKCRPVTRIDRDRPFEQSQSLDKPLLGYREVGCKRAQIEIVSGKVFRRAAG